MNRRDFLKSAGSVGAGFWITGLQDARALGKGPNEKLDVACIGVGGRGKASYTFCRGENIVAIVDCDEKHLDACSKETPKARRFVDYRKMYDEMAGQIDAVTIGTPDHHHGPAGARALALKKHVYIEKPLAHNIYEVRTLTEMAARAGVATQMGHQGHSYDNRRLLVEALEQKVIGEVREVHAWTDRPLWAQGIDRPSRAQEVPSRFHWDVFLGPAAERPYHRAYTPGKWRGWWDFGTGALGDMACHIMDATYWGLKLGYPRTIEVEGDPLKPETGPRWEVIRMTFPARGSMPEVKYTWYDGGKLPPAELAHGQTLKVAGNIIVGTQGTIIVFDAQGRDWRVFRDGDVIRHTELDVKQTLPRVSNGMRGHHDEWLVACKGGPKSLADFSTSGPFTEAVLIGIAAFRSGRKLEWDGPRMKAVNAPEAEAYLRREYRKGWEV